MKDIFAQKKLRLTEPRKLIYTVLAESRAPLMMAQLVKQCHAIDRTSIYRTLELFQELGLVSMTHIGWKKVYELNSPYKPHHHHFHCEVCGSFEDIESEAFEQLIEEIARTKGFAPTSHTFEVKGVCGTCCR